LSFFKIAKFCIYIDTTHTHTHTHTHTRVLSHYVVGAPGCQDRRELCMLRSEELCSGKGSTYEFNNIFYKIISYISENIKYVDDYIWKYMYYMGYVIWINMLLERRNIIYHHYIKREQVHIYIVSLHVKGEHMSKGSGSRLA